MTHRNDAAHAADVLGRWRVLAEQRLEYLTELFESGRWRRFHGEEAFLENIREAKTAVDTWRTLAAGGTLPQEPLLRVTWPEPARDRRPLAIEPMLAAASEPVATPAAIESEIAAAQQPRAKEPVIDLAALEQALGTAEEVLDLATIEQRYPLLRNRL